MTRNQGITNTILELVGETPLVQLHTITKPLKGTYFAKLEAFNPGHSAKDRIALHIVESAERKGILKKGDTILEEIPVPRVKSGTVLIQTTRTLVSLGTERMLVDFGKANLLQKAKQQPDKVKMVIDKIKTGVDQEKNVSLLRDLGDTMVNGSLCAMGGMTPFPVISALNYFPEDFGLEKTKTSA